MIKIGAACKWTDNAGTVADSNFKLTTVSGLAARTPKERDAKLTELIVHNLKALHTQLTHVAALPECLRMWRLGSDLLPLATHALTQKFYAQPKIERAVSHALMAAGKFARQYNIRLSFHPGQFVVLGSQSKDVRENSIRELEYHCEVFDRMGYTGWHPNGLAVNVHVGLKDPNVSAMRTLLHSRSSSVKNFITLENDEFSWGAEAIVDTFGDIVPLVLDVHHYWIHTGKRLQPNTKFIDQIRYTWRGVQPKLHLAISHKHLCKGVKAGDKMVLQKLLDAGNTRAGLRAHCEDPWHTYSIDYAAQFGFDIMWEGKNKNVGAVQIAKHLKLI